MTISVTSFPDNELQMLDICITVEFSRGEATHYKFIPGVPNLTKRRSLSLHSKYTRHCDPTAESPRTIRWRLVILPHMHDEVVKLCILSLPLRPMFSPPRCEYWIYNIWNWCQARASPFQLVQLAAFFPRGWACQWQKLGRRFVSLSRTWARSTMKTQKASVQDFVTIKCEAAF